MLGLQPLINPESREKTGTKNHAISDKILFVWLEHLELMHDQ